MTSPDQEFEPLRNQAISEADHALLLALDSRDLERAQQILKESTLSVDGVNVALCHACTFGWKEAVKLLLDNGATPNYKAGTPLRGAVTENKLEIVQMLLESGVKAKCCRGILVDAAERNLGEMISLMKRIAKDRFTPDHERALQAAKLQGASEARSALLSWFD